jgi:hypothetical protein
MLAQIRHQLLKSLVSLQSRRGCPDRFQTCAKVTGWPLRLIAYHQAQKVQRLFW